jgi:hypothetical protein
MLRRIFGPKRDEVTREWRKLHNEELTDLYSLPSIVRMIKSRRMKWVGHVKRIWGEEVYTGFWWGNLRERDNLEGIKMVLHVVGCKGMDWIDLGQDRERWRTLVNAVMNLRVPQNAGNFLINREPVSFPRTLLHRVSKPHKILELFATVITQCEVKLSLCPQRPKGLETHWPLQSRNQ